MRIASPRPAPAVATGNYAVDYAPPRSPRVANASSVLLISPRAVRERSKSRLRESAAFKSASTRFPVHGLSFSGPAYNPLDTPSVGAYSPLLLSGGRPASIELSAASPERRALLLGDQGGRLGSPRAPFGSTMPRGGFSAVGGQLFTREQLDSPGPAAYSPAVHPRTGRSLAVGASGYEKEALRAAGRLGGSHSGPPGALARRPSSPGSPRGGGWENAELSPTEVRRLTTAFRSTSPARPPPAQLGAPGPGEYEDVLTRTGSRRQISESAFEPL